MSESLAPLIGDLMLIWVIRMRRVPEHSFTRIADSSIPKTCETGPRVRFMLFYEAFGYNATTERRLCLSGNLSSHQMHGEVSNQRYGDGGGKNDAMAVIPRTDCNYGDFEWR